MTLWTGLIVFAAMAVLDYAHANCVAALEARNATRAAAWSILQWTGATVALVVAVKISLWSLPFEAAGLAFGTWLAVQRLPPHHLGA